MKLKNQMSLISEIQIRVALKQKIHRYWQHRKDLYWRKEIRRMILAYRQFDNLVSQ